jgi:hypothetical protein
MASPPVLALPNFNEPFVLEADASGQGIGAVIMQQGKPIAFFSKSLGPKAAASSTYEKEVLAILEALKKWKHYFASTFLIIKIDQQSLKYIQEQKLVEGIQHKLLIKLLGYNYKVEYKKGKENRVDDALSRAPHAQQLLTISSVVPAWIEQVTQSYLQDDHCLELLTKLSVDSTTVPNYTLANGILRHKGKVLVGNNGPLRLQLLDHFHKSALGGHSGERATYQ